MKRPTPKRKAGAVPKRGIEAPSNQNECGFCERTFPTVNDLYRRQQDEHDPHGIMFSELGIQK